MSMMTMTIAAQAAAQAQVPAVTVTVTAVMKKMMPIKAGTRVAEAKGSSLNQQRTTVKVVTCAPAKGLQSTRKEAATMMTICTTKLE